MPNRQAVERLAMDFPGRHEAAHKLVNAGVNAVRSPGQNR